jgi:hypothetical protein
MLVIFQVDFHDDHLMELQMMLELTLAFLSVSSCKGLLKLFNLHHHVGWCLYSLYPLNVAHINWIWNYTLECFLVTTPLLEECDDDTHTPEMGTRESSGIVKNFKFDFRSQNTSPWSVLHVIGKLLKCRCRKWPFMSHLDIYITSYGEKKGRESNWQFDSRPLKVGNRPDPGVCKWNATHCWKAFNESYKFASDLIPIRGLSKELWTHKMPRVQIGTISRLFFGSPGTKSHSDVGAAE